MVGILFGSRKPADVGVLACCLAIWSVLIGLYPDNFIEQSRRKIVAAYIRFCGVDLTIDSRRPKFCSHLLGLPLAFQEGDSTGRPFGTS